MVVFVALFMVMSMARRVDAAETSTPSITIVTTSTSDEGYVDTTAYTWYRIFDATIDEDPTSNGATQSGGKVAYTVDSAAKVAEINKTNLFNLVQVGTSNKWYVELKDETTTAETIATELGKIDLSVFATGNFAQTAVAGEATSGEVAPGYYYVTSTAGINVALQTLTAVTINEKNTFPTIEKSVDPIDVQAQIKDEINYTITITVPETANDTIVVTDTMDESLDFKEIVSVKNDNTDVDYTSATDSNPFTVTIAADAVKTVAAAETKTIVITYTATLNEKAKIDTDIPNKVKLDYGDHYTSVEKIVNIQTSHFSFDKVDGTSKEALTGAEFKLYVHMIEDDSDVELPVVEVTAGEVYRVATEDEIADGTSTTVIKTIGETVTINGLSKDVKYALEETKAPTGYNKLEDMIRFGQNEEYPVGGENAIDIENNKGATLPSTGGIGTTIFHVVGAALVLGAGVILIAKKRVNG